MSRAIPWSDIRLLIIDLDNTLCDTLHTLSHPQWRKVEDAFISRGWTAEARAVRREFGKRGFLRTLQDAKLTEEQVRFAIRVYDQVDIRSLRLFQDARSLLDVPLPKALISRGEPFLQRRKIAHLRIRRHFDDIRIISTFKDKEDAIRSTLRKHRLRPREALVIGDRIEEEIAAARRLRVPCVLVRRPDWPVGPHRVTPDLTVRDLRMVSRRLSGARLKNPR